MIAASQDTTNNQPSHSRITVNVICPTGVNPSESIPEPIRHDFGVDTNTRTNHSLRSRNAVDHLARAARISSKTSPDFIDSIRTASTLFDEIPVCTDYGKATFTKVRMNTRLVGIDGIRFRTPSKMGNFVAWCFVLPSHMAADWYVVPAHGNRQLTLPTPFVKEVSDFENPPVPEGHTIFVQSLTDEQIQPDREYIMWFAFQKDTIVNVYASVSANPPPKESCRILEDNVEYRPGLTEMIKELPFGLKRKLTATNLIANAIWDSNVNLIEYALKHGAAISNASLRLAAAGADLHTMKYLIEHGANPNQKGGNRYYQTTPLHALCARTAPNTEYDRWIDVQVATIVPLFVRAGANINAADTAGNTPLMTAILGNHPKTALVLIEMGADTSLQNRDEGKALDMAEENGLYSVVRALRSAK